MWWNSDDYLKPSDSILPSFFSLKMQLTLRIWTWSRRKLNISVPSLILGQYFSPYLLAVGADDRRETQIKWLRLRLQRDDKTKSFGLLSSNYKSMLRIWFFEGKSLIFKPYILDKVWQYTHIFTHWALVRDKNVFVIDAFLCIWLMLPLPTSHWSRRPCPDFWLDKNVFGQRLMAH